MSTIAIQDDAREAFAAGAPSKRAAEAPASRVLADARAGIGTLVLGVTLTLLGWYGFSRTALHLSASAGVLMPVARASCSCDCFDGALKSGHGRGGYKSIYFNIDEMMPVLIAWTSAAGIGALLAVRTVASILHERRARPAMLLLVAVTVYPVFYGWWATWNYLNDRFYPLLPAQLLFLASELLVLLVALTLADARTAIHPAGLWTMIGVAAFHVTQNILDNNKPVLGMQLMAVFDVVVLIVAGVHTSRCVGGTFTASRTLLAGHLRGLVTGSLDTPAAATSPVLYSAARASRDAAVCGAAVLAMLVLKPWLVGG